LTQQTQRVIDDNFTDILSKADNMEEVEAIFKQKISDELSKNYGQKALVKTRVSRDIEKNITTQTLQNTFIPNPVLTELNRNQQIDKTNENNARNILNIRDKTTENMRSDQLRTFRTLTQRFNNEVQQKNHPNLGEERTQLFTSMKTEQQAVSYNQRGTSIEKFFSTISDNGKINLKDFEDIVDILERNEDIDINKFSPNFQTKRTQDTADNDLRLEDNDLRGNNT